MPTTPSTTSWLRLEPRSRDAEMTDGLQARLHDPLWLLARQWQVGELTAYDGGSPVAARCRVASFPLTRLRRGEEEESADVADVPLEVAVEAERDDGHPGLREAVEAGAHLMRLLRRAGLRADADAVVDRFPLDPADEPEGVEGGDDVRGFAGLVAGRVPDGRRLHEVVAALPRDDGGPTEPWTEPRPSDPDAVLSVLRDWWGWFTRTMPGSGRAPAAWVPDRLEHRFTAEVDGAGVVLGSPGHRGGGVDWYDLDVVAGGDRDDAAGRQVVRTVVPAPVRYRGMPRSRWWELEDSGTALSTTDVAREDLATLLFLEFALARGDDWSVVPVDLDVGAMHRVRSVVVTDTLGRRALVPSAAEVDGPGSAWRAFACTGAADGPDDDLLLVPPVLPAVLHGPVREEVLLRRDELANTAWAIERVVADRLGRPVRRGPGDRPATDDQAVGEDGLLLRLSTPVPENWVPLVPARRDGDEEVVLTLGRVLVGSPPAPRGVLLSELTDVGVPEEEVPRTGVRLSRRWVWARSADGETHLWTARRAEVRGGEAWSGLRFDALSGMGEDRVSVG